MKTYERRNGETVMVMPCPGCCTGPDGEIFGNAGFHKDWTLTYCDDGSEVTDDDPESERGTTSKAMWTCGNCGHSMGRVYRRSMGEIALGKWRAKEERL